MSFKYILEGEHLILVGVNIPSALIHWILMQQLIDNKMFK